MSIFFPLRRKHDAVEESRSDPGAPFAGIGASLERLLEMGASRKDLTDLVRGMQARPLFNLCYLLAIPDASSSSCRALTPSSSGGQTRPVAAADAVVEDALTRLAAFRT
jgi:hypothetical protein